MKHFRLSDSSMRAQIDLRFYTTDIENAVKKVNPNITVEVHKHYFTTNPNLSKRESITVSTILRQGTMEQLTSYRPCLFISTQRLPKAEMEENNDNDGTQEMD